MSKKRHRFERPLGELGDWPEVGPVEEPPAAAGGRETEWVRDHDTGTRDTTPALGTRAEPLWAEGAPDDGVALALPGWGDSRWSYLFKHDTKYAPEEPRPGQVAAAARRMRSERPMPRKVLGPFIKPPVWTWEVPVYFWVGGVASGAAFVAVACDAAGDEHAAVIARRVSLGAVSVAPPLLIADLGRPARFLNMLRIIKPRSPMNLGAWCLMAFSVINAAAVGADFLRLRWVARALGVLTAVLGGYLGSYTGVLLASTAVPLWARSKLFLGPIFVTTATATGAAATRLVLSATGVRAGHPTRTALGALEASAMVVETALSEVNHRRLGQTGAATREGRPGVLFRSAQAAVMTGLALQFPKRRDHGWRGHVASGLYLAGGLLYRFAWVEAGKASARDDEASAQMARGLRAREGRHTSVERKPSRLPRIGGLYGEAVRRASLAVESLIRR